MPDRPSPSNMARGLRKANVPAEAILWKALRNRALGGFKFRRQHPIGPYFVDFACVAAKVVVEVDGLAHLGERKKDALRARTLHDEGWCTLRFWNTEIDDDLDVVKEVIFAKCQE